MAGIIKKTSQQILDARRENERLKAELSKEKEKVQFLGLLLGDLDIDDLFDADEVEVDDDGE